MGSMWGWPRMKKNTQVSLFQNISLQRLPRPTPCSACWTFTCLQGRVTSRPRAFLQLPSARTLGVPLRAHLHLAIPFSSCRPLLRSHFLREAFFPGLPNID